MTATPSRDRPILFSGPMVRAILDGRKTQTRRVLSRDWSVLGSSWKSRKHDDIWNALRFHEAMSAGHKLRVPWCHPSDEPTPTDECAIYALYPPWDIGDRAWVRETWAAHRSAKPRIYAKGDGHPWGSPIYRATFGAMLAPVCEGFTPWRPSIHMPRWASRITLDMTEIRVERLQDISEEDARAEGVEPPTAEREDHDWSICPKCGGTGLHGSVGHSLGYREVDCSECTTFRARFEHLWNSIHGPGAWEANPWICAISFRAIHANIDATTPSGERG